ncbi:hypothetical protein [Roseateles sp. BYS87W]|uniref:Uncharacterized protein n=1 Tax=Pelomonas baiyunensis TaxID=3299026 RepID=A0ABW7H1T6_9BURK
MAFLRPPCLLVTGTEQAAQSKVGAVAHFGVVGNSHALLTLDLNGQLGRLRKVQNSMNANLKSSELSEQAVQNRRSRDAATH